MRSFFGVGSDVCGFQHRESALAGDGTAPRVCVGHKHAEGTLSKSRPSQVFSAEARRLGLAKPCRATSQQVGYRVPKPEAVVLVRIEGAALLNMRRPRVGHWNPVLILEKERPIEHIATDDRITLDALLPVSLD